MIDYCEKDAVISIQSGAKNEESQEWVSVLMRMYLRWGDANGFDVGIINSVCDGGGSCFQSVMLLVKGMRAYGNLVGESGVHIFTRFSPGFNLRCTSFAEVTVSPILDETDFYVDPHDMELFAYKSTGLANSIANAVGVGARLVYTLTGLTVQCSNYRTLEENTRVVKTIMRGLLYEGQRKAVGTYRRYVSYPYKRVRDEHTGIETGDIEGVLDGKVNPFISIMEKV